MSGLPEYWPGKIPYTYLKEDLTGITADDLSCWLHPENSEYS